MTTLKNKKGVSLVELIAVIVIMGIIATVGGISVATIIENSNKSAAAQTVSDVYSACENYYQVEGKLPTTLDDLVTKDYIKEATIDKLVNANSEASITISNDGNTLQLTGGEGTANKNLKVGEYYVTLTNGKWEASKTKA